MSNVEILQLITLILVILTVIENALILNAVMRDKR
jgi:hypothetical protein